MADFKPEDIINIPQIKLPDLRKFLGPAVIVMAGLLFLGSFLYSIGPDEVGVIQRFGKYVRTTMPGLHMKMPFGIEKATKVKVEYVFKEEFGFRTLKAGVKTRYSPRDYPDESLMLTGDLNAADVEWIVQFKIKEPVKFLFKIRNPWSTIRAISESAIRQVVGDRDVSNVLTVGRIDINQEVEEKMQEILDSYDCGIHIVTVKLQDVNPPAEVKPAFNEVNEAKQEKERMINQAWESYNRIIPKAKGEAAKTIREAEGYALKRVNRAKGDASKFIQTYNAYKDARDVTRRRLYLETLTKILPRAGKKFVIDSSQKGILPLLDLGKVDILEKGGAR